MTPKIDSRSNTVSVSVDENVFPRGVGLATAYRFLERCYVQIEQRPRRRLQLRLKGKEPLSDSALRSLGEEFGNELLNQLARHQVSERTEGLRAIIVGRALLSAEPSSVGDAEPGPVADGGPPAESFETLDYLEDPLGIAVPWEEEHGDKRTPAETGTGSGETTGTGVKSRSRGSGKGKGKGKAGSR